MSHTSDCATVADPGNPDRRCTCFEPDTDWSPDQPCGGISIRANGGPPSVPAWCEVHMKPWGHRRTRPPSAEAAAASTA